jgi:hypothetical protein
MRILVENLHNMAKSLPSFMNQNFDRRKYLGLVSKEAEGAKTIPESTMECSFTISLRGAFAGVRSKNR